MSTGNIALDRQVARWYPLIPHDTQLALCDAVANGVRFPLAPAGRRSGKTERFKRFIVKQSMKDVGMYFAAAPTYNQAKKIFWKDLKDLALSVSHPHRPSESDLIIFMPNGSEIHVIGLDKPERIEGAPWKGGGIDEFADTKPGAWEGNIFPALNTVNPDEPGYRAWCWLFGVPDGLNHYYDLCQKAETTQDDNFKVFHWKSADILPADVIADARSAMSSMQFRQEFEASFETARGRVYDDYSEANHTTREFIPGVIHWAHDFNYVPMSSAIIQVEGGNDYVVDEIIIDHAVARNAAIEFVERYKEHTNCPVIIYGDPSGRVGEKHGQQSNYKDIETILRNAGFTVERRVFSRTKSIRDGQNSLRSRVLTADGKRHLFVNPKTAPTVARGLNTVQLMKGSTYQEDENNNAQHVISGIRYYSSFQYPMLGGPTLSIS